MFFVYRIRRSGKNKSSAIGHVSVGCVDDWLRTGHHRVRDHVGLQSEEEGKAERVGCQRIG